jgi:TonB family protein
MTADWRASPNAHLLIGELPVQPQLAERWWEGTGVSIAAHGAALALLLYAGAHAPQMLPTASPMPRWNRVIFSVPGHGDGIRGGPTDAPARAQPAESAQPRARHIAATANPADEVTPPIEVPSMAAHAVQTLPGAIADVDATSLGRGSGPGSTGGEGLGSGGKGGRGVGDGGLDGAGGPFEPGNGVTTPQLIAEVKPQYTVDAMRAKLQGVVELEAVVLPDGSVDPRRIRVTRSLDRALGLDGQAVLAVRQWRFRPGTLKGRPVPVRVIVELTFTLR